MMRALKDAVQTVAVAFSMFSAVPVPQFEWNRRNMRFMLCAFPLVGALAGALMWLGSFVCGKLGLPPMVRGLILTAVPPLVTGGIHLDGCCDTWDALASHGTREKMRSILKDPHIGSFAVIRLILMLLAEFVLWTVLPDYRAVPVLAGFVLSRSLSGLAVASFPIAEGTGLARTFAEQADRRKTALFTAVLACASAAVMCLTGGWIMAAAAAAVFLIYRTVLVPKFGGLSGDLAGWFVQTAELWMLAALYAGEILEGVL